MNTYSSKDPTSVKVEGSIEIGKLIESYLTGPGGGKFNSLFEGEIRNKLLTPLFNNIQRQIESTPIQVGEINLKSVIQESINAFKLSDQAAGFLQTSITAAAFKTGGALIRSYDEATKALQDLKPQKVEESISKNILSKLDYSQLSKQAIKLPEIKLPAIELALDKTLINKYNALALDIIDSLVAEASKIKIQDTGIKQKNILQYIFNNTPEFNRSTTTEYQTLIKSVLDVLKQQVNEIGLDGSTKITQNNIFDILFKQTPEFGFLARWKFNSLREDAADILRKRLDRENINLNVEEGSQLTQSRLFNILFNQTPEMGKLSTWAFNTLRMKATDKLGDAVDKLNLNEIKTAISHKDIINILFSNTPEMGILSRINYELLTSKAIRSLSKGIDSFEIKSSSDSLTQKEVFELIFEKTPEMGLFTQYMYGGMVRNAIRKINTIVDGVSETSPLSVARNSANTSYIESSSSAEPQDVFVLKKILKELKDNAFSNIKAPLQKTIENALYEADVLTYEEFKSYFTSQTDKGLTKKEKSNFPGALDIIGGTTVGVGILNKLKSVLGIGARLTPLALPAAETAVAATAAGVAAATTTTLLGTIGTTIVTAIAAAGLFLATKYATEKVSEKIDSFVNRKEIQSNKDYLKSIIVDPKAEIDSNVFEKYRKQSEAIGLKEEDLTFKKNNTPLLPVPESRLTDLPRDTAINFAPLTKFLESPFAELSRSLTRIEGQLQNIAKISTQPSTEPMIPSSSNDSQNNMPVNNTIGEYRDVVRNSIYGD